MLKRYGFCKGTSLLLAAALVVSAGSMTVFADGVQETGTAAGTQAAAKNGQARPAKVAPSNGKTVKTAQAALRAYAQEAAEEITENFVAEQIAAGDRVSVIIDEAGETVWYSFTPESDGYYRFYTTGDYDTVAYLCDAEWNSLQENDDGNNIDYNAELTYNCEAGETYYIGFQLLDNTATGIFTAVVKAVDEDAVNHEAWMDEESLDTLTEGTVTYDYYEMNYYQFTAEKSAYYSFTVDSFYYAEAYIYIYGADGGIITSLYSSTGYPAAVYLEAGTTYYVYVENFEYSYESMTMTFAQADLSGTCGEDAEWKFDESTLTISGSGALTDYDETAAPWYCFADSITEVVVEDGITAIGNWAFESLYCMSDVTLPSTITDIGDYAFIYCCSLKGLTLPEGVTQIGTYAFYDCEALLTITLSDSLIQIGTGAFEYCVRLTDITIPEGVAKIPAEAFYSCWELKNVSLPSTITAIKRYAFCDCEALEGITLPESLRWIGEYAFSACYALKSITIPENVTLIQDYAFSYNTDLQTVTFACDGPDLEDGIFYGDTLTAYYPQTSGWTADLLQQYEGTVTWSGYAAAGTDQQESDSSEKTESDSSVQDVSLREPVITIKASSLKKTIKLSKLKKKKQTFKLNASADSDGKIAYEKISGNKKITVSKNGKVTVKRGLKKGKTYKVKVKITTAETASYSAKSVIKTVKIKVK